MVALRQQVPHILGTRQAQLFFYPPWPFREQQGVPETIIYGFHSYTCFSVVSPTPRRIYKSYTHEHPMGVPSGVARVQV